MLAVGAFSAACAAEERVWRDAVVVLSNGEKIVGKVNMTGNSIHLFVEAQSKRYKVHLDEIAKIESLLEDERMEKKWFFKEDGRDEKVYTGDKYPLRQFITRITFDDGKALEGHILGRALWVDDGQGEPRHLVLRRQMEGKVGQTLKDLVYVQSVTMTDKGEGVVGAISGTVEVPPQETVVRMMAINRKNDYSIEARVSADGRFHFSPCTAGTYDLVVVTGGSVYAYFSIEKEKGCARLSPDVLKEIADWVKLLKDVFEVQEPVYGAGNADRLYVLVHMQRTGKLSWSYPEQMAWVKLLRRYEVWLMHKPYDEWQRIKIFPLHRYLSGDAGHPKERVVVCPALGGHTVSSQHQNVQLDLKLAPTGEPLVGPPARAGEEDAQGMEVEEVDFEDVETD